MQHFISSNSDLVHEISYLLGGYSFCTLISVSFYVYKSLLTCFCYSKLVKQIEPESAFDDNNDNEENRKKAKAKAAVPTGFLFISWA